MISNGRKSWINFLNFWISGKKSYIDLNEGDGGDLESGKQTLEMITYGYENEWNLRQFFEEVKAHTVFVRKPWNMVKSYPIVAMVLYIGIISWKLTPSASTLSVTVKVQSFLLCVSFNLLLQ